MAINAGHDLSRIPPPPSSIGQVIGDKEGKASGPQSDVRELTCDRQMLMRRRWSSFGPLVATIAENVEPHIVE
jgi:hypothetical protein